MTLFREEVRQARAQRLHGSVSIAVPLTWQIIGWLLFALLVAAGIVLWVGSYARIVTVDGVIVADTGVVDIRPRRSGVVSAVWVREGQQVRAGAVLASIRADEDLATGATASDQALAALHEKDRRLAGQMRSVQISGESQQSGLRDEQAGLSAGIASLQQQISLQKELIRSAEDDLAMIQPLAARGFISKTAIRVKEETLVSRRQQLEQMQATLVTNNSQLLASLRSSQRIKADTMAQEDAIQGTRADVAQNIANTAGGQSYVLKAPVSGRVTAMSARLGQNADPSGTMMILVPEGATLQAELYLPTSAVGFVVPGQSARLAIDAFPFQSFGTVDARVIAVAQTTTTHRNPDNSVTPIYLATAAIRGHISAYGKSQRLLPGMTLQAKITTARQGLFEWIFDSVLAERTK